MLLRTVLLLCLTVVVVVLAKGNQFNPLPQHPARRDQKTFQHIQSILRKNYERTLWREHQNFRRRNSRFLNPVGLKRVSDRRPRKINVGRTKIQVLS